jgi:hypothetical protein
MSSQSERARTHTSPKTLPRGLFLLEGGISGQSDNKKYAGYKFIQPNLFLAKSEHARARTSPKTCARGLFFIEGGISG